MVLLLFINLVEYYYYYYVRIYLVYTALEHYTVEGERRLDGKETTKHPIR